MYVVYCYVYKYKCFMAMALYHRLLSVSILHTPLYSTLLNDISCNHRINIVLYYIICTLS